MNHADISGKRTVRAVEKVRGRLRRATAAFETAGIEDAIVGGNAIAGWIFCVDEAAVRNTQGRNPVRKGIAQRAMRRHFMFVRRLVIGSVVLFTLGSLLGAATGRTTDRRAETGHLDRQNKRIADADLFTAPALDRAALRADNTAVDLIGGKLRGVMIWDAVDTSSPASVGFRKEIALSVTPASATLHIFADTRYVLWINGTYVARGPNRFDPKRPEYDTLNVRDYLDKGRNTLAVLVQSHLSNYRFIDHAPGLGLLLETRGREGHAPERFETDRTWRSSASTRFAPPVVMLSGITDRVDEHREQSDWTTPGFDDSQWETTVAVAARNWGAFHKRMIPLLRESKVEGGHILAITKDGKTEKARQSLDASMPLELTAPATVVIDVGQMVRAYFRLDFEPHCDSHYELRPRQSHTNRAAHFLGSCHYQTTARPGRRIYFTTDEYTCRLIHLHLHKGKVTIHGLEVIERRYPFDRVGSFRCNDDFLNQLWNMSIRTSELNAVDGYIDGSEGGEWVTGHIDYPVTRVAFAAFSDKREPVYSDMRLLGNQISRMALSQTGDALIKGWHPSDWHLGPRDSGRGIHNFIEDSSCCWVNLLRLYYDGTGDSELVEREWPVLEKVMQWFLDRRTERGLVNVREFFLHFDNPIAFHVCEVRHTQRNGVPVLHRCGLSGGKTARSPRRRHNTPGRRIPWPRRITNTSGMSRLAPTTQGSRRGRRRS